jgi:hypothetical protein
MNATTPLNEFVADFLLQHRLLPVIFWQSILVGTVGNAAEPNTQAAMTPPIADGRERLKRVEATMAVHSSKDRG